MSGQLNPSRPGPFGFDDGPRAVLRDWDVLLLLILLFADIRIFKNNSVASFTLLELFVWGYCLPVLLGHALWATRVLAPAQTRFMGAVGIYIGWTLVASLFGLLARQHSDVLQQAKNIAPVLPMVGFLFVRLRSIQSVSRLANLYVIYCLAACILAVMQMRYSGPYFRSGIGNNEYKLDFAGEIVSSVILGFSNTPNELAVAVLPGAMFSTVKLVSELRDGPRVKLVTLICCAMTLLVLTLAQSRGAIVWFMFGFLCVVGPLRRNRSFLLKLTLVTGLITTLVVYGMRADPASIDIENTIQSRVMLWWTSIDALTSEVYTFLLGDGIRFVLSRSWQVAGWEFPDAHNGWLDQALFFGAPALLFYMVIWYRFFVTTERAIDRGPESSVLLEGIRGTVLAYMGLYFFEPVAAAVFNVSQIFLLMSCGLVLACLPPRLTKRGLTDQVVVQAVR